MHLVNLPKVLATLNYIVVELIPKGDSSQLGAWEACNGTEYQSMNTETQEIGEGKP
jgi:hypothetical protein